MRDSLLNNTDCPPFTDAFVNHKIISNIMTMTVPARLTSSPTASKNSFLRLQSPCGSTSSTESA